ncbi:MAG: TlpA family protein disulfide reductase [Bacteroidales bacterium]|nr:TlpA family protein disulfide reductase [Bacteroidales bacterium]
MRNKLIIIAAIFAFAVGANAQNADEAKNVLRLCREKCHSIKGGHYESEYRTKYMDFKDTISSILSCDFVKDSTDKVFGKRFHSIEKYPNWTRYSINTDKEFAYGNDKELERLPHFPWIRVTKSLRHNFEFYEPLTNPDNSVLPNGNSPDDSLVVYSLTDTMLDGKACYDITRLDTTREQDIFGGTWLRNEKRIWIDKQTYLPIQFYTVQVLVEGKDTLCQYTYDKLLSFDTTINYSRFTLESLPDEMIVIDYVPEKSIKPLGRGKRAPEWTLPTISGDSISLADLRGKVVLIDFFYKACAPCCAALPTLQRMHEKYKDQGVVVIGIDPYDDPVKADMADFIEKRSVGYTVVFSDRELPQKYRVTSYPTLFFINEKGKIVKYHEGFSASMEEEVEKQIQKMLKK